jgi:hypothetical protein
MTFIVDGTSGLTFPNSTLQASAGVVLQVVQSGYNTQSNTTSSSYVTTGFSVSITPKFSTSKVLVSFTCPTLQAGSAEMQFAIYRGGSQITGEYKTNTLSWSTATIEYLDSPATASSTTYTIYYKMVSGTGPVYMGTGATLNNVFVTAKEIAQ